MKNHFQRVCKELEKCDRCYEKNEITCAISFLKKYTNNDRNKLLVIKAEAEKESSAYEYSVYIASAISLIVCSFSFIIENKNTNIAPLSFVLFWFIVYSFVEMCRRRIFKKWKQYVIVAINEMLENDNEIL